MQTARLLPAGLGVLSLSMLLTAGDWPQFRGPQRTASSTEKGLLKQWPAGGPKLLWHAKDIGFGYATPSVVGNRIYLLSNRGLDNEFVQALDAADAKQVWATRIGKVGNPNQQPTFPAARSTPTVEGSVLYALGSDGDLACMDIAGGKILWQKNLRAEFGGKPGAWAYSESPLIDGDAVVATPGGPQATVVALNKKTGALLWKSAVPGGDPAGYASVMPFEAAGRKQYVQYLENGVAGVDARTGQFLWRYDGTKSITNIPTVVTGNGQVYVAGSGVGALLRIVPAEAGLKAEVVYKLRGLPSAIGGSVLVGNVLYGTGPQALVAVDFSSGRVLWSNPCIGAASILYADGLLFLHGENGSVALVEATPDAYREKGRFTPPDPPKHTRGSMEKAWPYPVVANGRLYIRDVDSLWSYAVTEH